MEDILRLIPHRYPFLLIDKVLDYGKFDFLRAIKNVTANEPFFQGHFPDNPIMPGVLMLEALAQAGGLLHSVSSREDHPEKSFMYYLAGVDNVKFKHMVVPGDQLTVDIKCTIRKNFFWRMEGTVHVGDKLACSAEILSAVKEIEK